MGKLIKNHWARLIILTAATYQVLASLHAFFWPKLFFDFLTTTLDPCVRPVPALQIVNLLLGLVGLAWEWPLPLFARAASAPCRQQSSTGSRGTTTTDGKAGVYAPRHQPPGGERANNDTTAVVDTTTKRGLLLQAAVTATAVEMDAKAAASSAAGGRRREKGGRRRAAALLSGMHRSIEARLMVYPLSSLASLLLYQGTNAGLYYIVGMGVYFWAFSEGEVVMAVPWTLPTPKRRKAVGMV